MYSLNCLYVCSCRLKRTCLVSKHGRWKRHIKRPIICQWPCQVTVKRQRLNIKREDLLTNSDTLYKSLNLLLWPLLRRYNVSFILSMMECMSVVNCLFDDAVKERKLTKDISDALQATTDAMTRTTAAEANVKVL